MNGVFTVALSSAPRVLDTADLYRYRYIYIDATLLVAYILKMLIERGTFKVNNFGMFCYDSVCWAMMLCTSATSKLAASAG